MLVVTDLRAMQNFIFYTGPEQKGTGHMLFRAA